MSRLYYEKSKQREETIDFRGVKSKPNLEGENPRAEKSNVKSYLEKVSTIIPAEIIAGYLAMLGFLSKGSDGIHIANQNLLIGILIFSIILTPLYLYYHSEENKPKIIHLLVSTIAFMVWAFVTSGEKFNISFYSAETASVILVAFSLVSGLIPMRK
jgi:hypothetical protein